MTQFKILTRSKERLKELNKKLREEKIKFRTKGISYKNYNFGMIPKEKERQIRLILRKLKLDYEHTEADRIILDVLMTDDEYYKVCNTPELDKKQITKKELIIFLKKVRRNKKCHIIK